MPIHDWARVDADLFHHFHRCWTVAICDTLNRGLLPTDFSALLERRKPDDSLADVGLRGDRVVIRWRLSEVVSVIEIVSSGDKRSKRSFETLIGQAVQLLGNGVDMLIVDMFPPSLRDPRVLPVAVWEELGDSFDPGPGKPLSLATFVADHRDNRPAQTVYMEPIAVGDLLPDMPVFLGRDTYVPVPLEATYQVAWTNCPPSMRELVETGRLSDE